MNDIKINSIACNDFKFKILNSNYFCYFKFLIGGGLSLLLNLFITFILTEIFNIWYMASFAIALGIEIFFLFLYHSVVTFRKRGNFLLFFFVILFISDLNWILVYLTTELLNWYYLFAIVIVAGAVSIINFLFNRIIVFKPNA